MPRLPALTLSTDVHPHSCSMRSAFRKGSAWPPKGPMPCVQGQACMSELKTYVGYALPVSEQAGNMEDSGQESVFPATSLELDHSV